MEPQMEGMAAMGVPQGPSTAGTMTLDQVIDLLMEGMKPEELIAAGVPQALVEQAMMELNAATQAAPAEAGLAGMQVPQSVG